VTPAPPLVLDWDGTVTEVDTLHMVIERFGDLGVFHALEERIARDLTLHEVIALEMRTVTAPLDEVVAFLREAVRVRDGFADLVARFDPLIVSAGFHELIDPILAREGVRARVTANHVDARPEGWVASFAPAPVCTVCGERCKRSILAGLLVDGGSRPRSGRLQGLLRAGIGASGSGSRVSEKRLQEFAFVGDGVSDRCVALAATRRFARAGLARWLDERGVPYEPFTDLDDVAARLGHDPPPPSPS
jgi:2-hydroxy-3-keto-5-methylthiopentenyl-1-phosphate phosphatase